jgi:hypothetical protein
MRPETHAAIALSGFARVVQSFVFLVIQECFRVARAMRRRPWPFACERKENAAKRFTSTIANTWRSVSSRACRLKLDAGPAHFRRGEKKIVR